MLFESLKNSIFNKVDCVQEALIIVVTKTDQTNTVFPVFPINFWSSQVSTSSNVNERCLAFSNPFYNDEFLKVLKHQS